MNSENCPEYSTSQKLGSAVKKQDTLVFQVSRHDDGQLYYVSNLPTVRRYYFNGQIRSEEWYRDDRLHRDGGLPAVIDYYSNGQKNSEWWFINGQRHQDNDLPAVKSYYSNGPEEWYRNGLRDTNQ